MLDVLNPVPADSTMSLIERCRADSNPDKIDLGVGVFQNDAGETPVLDTVKEAEAFLKRTEATKSYVSPTGDVDFRARMLALVLGGEGVSEAGPRMATIQAAGGSGALRIGTDLIKAANPDATIWVSTPTWVNHFPLMGSSGLRLKAYPYYDAETMTLQFEEMLAFLTANAKVGDAVLLHGCCHNPSGMDLSPHQWDVLADFLAENRLCPFVDLAYFGLGQGFEEDTYGVRKLVQALPEVIIAASCSKNFAIYRERVGFLAVSQANETKAAAIQSHLGTVQRKLISMPPSHGAAVVSHILGSDELRGEWLGDVKYMRERVDGLRHALAAAIGGHSGGGAMAEAIQQQSGLFSLLPLSSSQIAALWKQSIYLTEEGRINIAGANAANLDRLAHAIMSV